MLPKRVYAKVNLDNIQKNIDAIKAKLPENTNITGIVKADAYGHGATKVTEFLCELGIKRFGVATMQEALDLRNDGVTAPILILGETFKEDFPLAVDNNIDCTVSDYQTAKVFADIATKIGKEATVHIKIDTGMGRIGFQPDKNSLEEIKKIFQLNGISVAGIFTHFACADHSDKTSAENQRKKYLEFTDKLIADGYEFRRHMYNSAAVMELDGYCGDSVRCGIMMYGLYPSAEMSREFSLFPVMELKSSISFIKDVGKGFTVSYGSTFVADKDMKIATVPVGYADGYPRYLSNKGEVVVNGVRCKIIGKICMDQFMIDASAVPDAKVGDEVTLMGVDGTETITVEDLSDPEYRFNYELCCLINKRVPRIYVRNGKII